MQAPLITGSTSMGTQPALGSVHPLFVGVQSQLPLHQASNSSRCSSSIIENSSSSPSWLSSFSVINYLQRMSEHSGSPRMHECRGLKFPLCMVGPTKRRVDAEVLFSDCDCEVSSCSNQI